jgi:ornithine cyclodeaminase/alanine dehydrogenase-like protein (mu-crystallin family)
VRELTDADVAAVPLTAVVDEVARCLADLGTGAASQAPKAVLPVGPGAFFLSLAGVVPRLGLAVAKWASYVPGAAGRPGTSTSTVVVSDARTGAPRALVGGMGFTQRRTAATAVAVARAATPGSGAGPVGGTAAPRTVALVGCGATNRAVLDAVLATAPDADVRVLVRSASSAAALRESLAPVVAGRLDVATDPVVLSGADWAFSATGATEAVATLGLLAPGGVAVALDGARTWRLPAGTSVLDDHVRPGGEVPSVPLLLAGRLERPAGRVLLDVAGSAVCDVALAACLVGVTA